MTSFFFYGTMCHGPLRDIVLGRDVPVRQARLGDHAVHQVAGQDFPMISAQPGTSAEGCIAEDLTVEEVARLSYYEGGFGYRLQQVAVAGQVVQIWMPDPGRWRPEGDWSLGDWVRDRAPVVLETARDVMAFRKDRPQPALATRWPMMQVRAASRLRARQSPGGGVAHDPAPGDIEIKAAREPYANFFAIEEYDLRHRRFDGSMSEVINRAVFISGDAATVLPYDPVRDRVLVIEQLRMGPLGRGDAHPWLLEPIAGRVDPWETPETAARREAEEEAGLTLDRLLPIANYYPSPAAKAEYLYSYVAIADLPDGVAGTGGLESESEDIRAHLLEFDALMRLLDSGAATNAPLILSALWLARQREALRAGA